jgi:hypothetical protein
MLTDTPRCSAHAHLHIWHSIYEPHPEPLIPGQTPQADWTHATSRTDQELRELIRRRFQDDLKQIL